MTWIPLASILLGLAVVAITAKIYRSDINWAINLTGPAWDFNRSWASNLTVAGSILSYASLLSAVGVNTKLYPRTAFALLSALAGGTALVAPLVFLALRRILLAMRWRLTSSIAFLAGAAVTFAALSMQIGMGVCMITELLAEGVLNLMNAVIIDAAAAIVLAATLWYAVLSARDVLIKAPATEAHIDGQTAQPFATGWALL
jgi:hypothetical protein